MPERLGPYLLDKRIGAGGMADVFLAQGPRGRCVVKRPYAQLCANPEFVRMFLDEAALLAQLHHPGIAEIFDLGQVGGVYYLAMEYVPGFDLMTISLEHERNGELMAPELCARIIADSAGALHYAHEARGQSGQPLDIIHRDVTPHNILLSTQGVVKLIDFGVAKASTAMHHTQAGLVKGKYAYMAPEQITNQSIDRRVDVYALGLCLYELLTNVRAIAGDLEVEQIENARSGRVRPIEQLRPNVPAGLLRVLASCLHPEPSARYPTAQHLRVELESFIRTEHQLVGQEDLLRLFRVVAADVSHLEASTAPVPGGDQPWLPERPTDEQLPLSAPGPDSGAPIAEGPSGLAPTYPSLGRLTGQPPPLQLGPSQVVPPPARRGAGLVVAALAVAIVVGVAAAWYSGFGRSRAADSLAPLPDAGFAGLAELPLIPIDSGGLVADVPAQVIAASVVLVSTCPTCPAVEVYANGKHWGRSPRQLELAAGPYTLGFVNKDLHYSRSRTVELKPGEFQRIDLALKTGTVALSAEPLAQVKVNGDPIGAFTFKTLQLCEGLATFDLTLDDNGKTYHKVEKVEVKAGETQALTVQMRQ